MIIIESKVEYQSIPTSILIEWVNDELHSERIIVQGMPLIAFLITIIIIIIVQDIEEDLYDGQILQKLLEKLTGEKLMVPEVTQSEEGQRNKLRWGNKPSDNIILK